MTETTAVSAPELVKLTIDGVAVEVAKGTTIVRAAKQFGLSVPTFCYHPGLSIPANCRMCLVDVTWGNGRANPKPLPGCYTEAGEGMVVDTKSPGIRAVQQSVLEFILLNHPVDCPICDQAGECVLQEHYVQYSAQPSRLSHQKVAKPKATPLGPRVLLDSERCIVCTRCIRVCDEIAGRSELAIDDRGNHSQITTFPGRQLENPYSLNTVDVCPVGALTDKRFRFRRRVWFLTKKESVCTGCARGCSLRLDSYNGTTERVVPRYNPDVNNWWMCDDGRDYMRDRTVQNGPLARDASNDGATTKDTLDKVASYFAEDDPNVAIALSASLENEAVYAWSKLAHATGAKVYLLRRETWHGDNILRADDRDANASGAVAIITAITGACGDEAALIAGFDDTTAVLVVDNDSAPSDELIEALGAHDGSVVMSDVESGLTEASAIVLPIGQLHTREGTLTNAAGWVQRIGQPLPAPRETLNPTRIAALFAAANGVDIGITATSSPSAVFANMAAEVPAFANLSYSYLGDLGGKLTHGGEPAPQRLRVDGTPEWEPDDVHPTAKRRFAIRRGTSDVITPRPGHPA